MTKRKNRHLVETARTLLLHHMVPQRFWGDAILATCYLINRMPSSVLHDKIPHSIIFPNQLSFAFPFMSLVVFVLSIFLLLDKTSIQPKPRSVSFLVIFGFNEVIVGTLLIHINTLSLLMSHFLRTLLYSLPPTPPNSDVISLPLLYPVLDTSSVPPITPPRPLQVYTRHPYTDIRPLADSSPMALSSMTPILPSPADLPITVRKGTRSSCNPYLIYNFLTYHRLSSPYSVFISTLSSVSLPKTLHEALSHPGWEQAMVEEMAALHSIGTWDLVTLPAGKSPVSCR